MPKTVQTESVFLNCPFDGKYSEIFDAVVFAVHDAGFLPRCALEADDGSEVRIDKIYRLIRDCRFGIHDISRTELDRKSRLPRFNMPFELGLFLGSKQFGSGALRKKSCLILDHERYRYQAFLSDIAGQDIREHRSDPKLAIKQVRRFLNAATHWPSIPGEAAIIRRFQRFQQELPLIRRRARIRKSEVTFLDYSGFAAAWLKATAPAQRT